MTENRLPRTTIKIESSMPSLVLFSGPPGVGKTSLSYKLARQTGWAILPKDQFDRTLERLELPERPSATAYELMFDLAELNLRNRVSVILDAVFPLQNFRQRASELALFHDAAFFPVVCFCSDRYLWQNRLQQRLEMIEDWTPVGWEDAMRVEGYYEPWREPHLALDSCQSFEQNFKTLLNFVLPT